MYNMTIVDIVHFIGQKKDIVHLMLEENFAPLMNWRKIIVHKR